MSKFKEKEMFLSLELEHNKTVNSTKLLSLHTVRMSPNEH